MPNTEAHKRARKRWIENNYQFHLDLHNLYSKAYYLEHRDEILEKRKEYQAEYRAKKRAEKLAKKEAETLGKL
jgi:hypothetical protein